MKLAYLLEGQDLEKYLDILKEVEEDVDIIWLARTYRYYGVDPTISRIKEKFPNKEFCFDRKIIGNVEGNEHSMDGNFLNGINYISLEALLPKPTFEFMARKAKELNGNSVLEMRDDINYVEKLRLIDSTGEHIVLVETRYDKYGNTKDAYEYLDTAKTILKKSKVAVKGDINETNFDEIISYNPDIVLVDPFDCKKPIVAFKEMKNKIKSL